MWHKVTVSPGKTVKITLMQFNQLRPKECDNLLLSSKQILLP